MTASTTERASAPQVAVNDIGSAEDFLAAIDETIKYFNDGDIVEGVIVKVDRDEVLLDIGYKTEGVIPSRELSIRHDVDPNEVVKVQQKVEVTVVEVDLDRKRIALSMRKNAVGGQKPAEGRTSPASASARPQQGGQPRPQAKPQPKPAAKPAGEGWFSAALKEARKK